MDNIYIYAYYIEKEWIILYKKNGTKGRRQKGWNKVNN